MPEVGGTRLLAPGSDGRLALAAQTEMMTQGVRECISLVLQDGRTLVCTPDHQVLCADGTWKRADELVLGKDRVVVGLEAPLDEPGSDEAGYVLQADDLQFTLDSSWARNQTLAFARLLGHLLRDGSISVEGQGRMTVGQAVDREVVLSDIELVTGKRPKASQYDERKWSIALPKELTTAILSLPGVSAGRRIHQPAELPAFILDENCPVAVVREFLGGLFGADGHAPVLKRQGEREEDAGLRAPAYSQSALPEHVGSLREMMDVVLRLLARCGVKTEGANVYEYPTRRSDSSYPVAQDGEPRIEVRLLLPDGLSFVERVGFRYCVDKALRASAAAVYWRMVAKINEQRLWMSERLTEVHQEDQTLSFSKARQLAAMELGERETAVFPHYSLLEGSDRFSRLPQPTDRSFQPLHRDACGFPSPVELFRHMGVRDWFARLESREETDHSKRYCTPKDALTLPTFTLEVIDRRDAGEHAVFDLAVDEVHSFVAGTFAVHNCIGNSGPLPQEVVDAITEGNLVAAAVLSGNRNFEGRIHANVKANYLASPPLVVAYALAGSVDKDLVNDPIGQDPEGNDVYLKDIWPTLDEIKETISRSLTPEMFTEQYGNVYAGNEMWNQIPVAEGALYDWKADSTYIQHPPFFQELAAEPEPMRPIDDARVLLLLGDSITTDHISPAGSIAVKSPAGQYLIDHGVEPADFNSYGSRRGNHEVMMRGTFANIRIKNQLLPGTEGPKTLYLPSGQETSIYDAAMKYKDAEIPLIVLAGKEYGTGSSRDWAAKGTYLLGIRAVIAESYERIHRSNLVGMGVIPLQFDPGQGWQSLGLTGTEVFDIEGISDDMAPNARLTITAQREDGSVLTFQAKSRLDTPVEINYYRNGGILHTVLRAMAKESRGA
ncbi:MAG: hypothetical protein H0T73_06620 [Ardenticatenales bacterium]|nr:hypothetical protein [Ardenticatenales bacterium]